MADKEVIIIAGPNGAGKTTFAQKYLPGLGEDFWFINADEIATGLDPLGARRTDVQAGRLMLAKIDRLVDANQSFAFETTLAARCYLRKIKDWRARGYRITLLFLSLHSEEGAVERVKARAKGGGHDVPEQVIRRRFKAGMKNFRELYADRVDDWVLFDSSGPVPKIIEGRRNER